MIRKFVGKGTNVSNRDLALAAWRKSTRSTANGDCVEVADNLPGVIAVRDSKNPTGPALVFTPAELAAFVGGVKDGEFDL
jgi:Domain of unknown function (DUF397)